MSTNPGPPLPRREQVLDILVTIVRWRPPRALWGWALAALLVVVLAAGYLLTQKAVALTIDGETAVVYTHQGTVREVLNEAGVTLAPDDALSPPLDASLRSGDSITIRRPFTATIHADGDTAVLRTHEATVGQLLTRAGVTLGPYDVVTVNGQETDVQTMLWSDVARQTAMAGGGMPLLPVRSPMTVEIAVRRAIPLTVYDDGVPMTLHTVQPTVGDALRVAGMPVYLADEVSPALGTPAVPEMRVTIQRSTPLVITADGLTFRTRTRQPTLGQALEEEGLRLQGQDRMEPPGPAPVQSGVHVRLIRVREVYLTDAEPIPYQTVWKGDPTLDIDNQRLDIAGTLGAFDRMTRIVYEDGNEVLRGLYREWMATEPITRVIAYGTKIVVRQEVMADGTPIQYWRKVRVVATAYNEDECGKLPGDPEYGITSMGWRVRPGIVAVDPRVIGLGTPMYVPGYGSSIAGDTGSLIKGLRIDLYYQRGHFVEWNRWITVYLLAPAPSRSKIRWILPTYPVERQRGQR